ncbi:conserved hypothetical protein [Ricinus communis]|uniref:Uncharacterized protein n=1 Tax=Ricinus communis TaxID=3988 RepID=B9TD53_RICCO|nr:conserved hypothetical protein [Ricinus communis]
MYSLRRASLQPSMSSSAFASASPLRDSTRMPCGPIASGTPPTRVAITGRPLATASSTARPNPSDSDGSTK